MFCVLLPSACISKHSNNMISWTSDLNFLQTERINVDYNPKHGLWKLKWNGLWISMSFQLKFSYSLKLHHGANQSSNQSWCKHLDCCNVIFTLLTVYSTVLKHFQNNFSSKKTEKNEKKNLFWVPCRLLFDLGGNRIWRKLITQLSWPESFTIHGWKSDEKGSLWWQIGWK